MSESTPKTHAIVRPYIDCKERAGEKWKCRCRNGTKKNDPKIEKCHTCGTSKERPFLTPDEHRQARANAAVQIPATNRPVMEMNANEQIIAIAEACGIEIQRLSSCCAAASAMEEYGICPVCYDGAVFEPDLHALPDYCADLNAAITLCDALAKEGWICNLHSSLTGEWECVLERESDGGTPPEITIFSERLAEIAVQFSHTAETLPLAISGAFLKARGIGTGKEADA